MAMIAAMKKVLSPISEAPMTPIDFTSASRNLPERERKPSAMGDVELALDREPTVNLASKTRSDWDSMHRAPYRPDLNLYSMQELVSHQPNFNSCEWHMFAAGLLFGSMQHSRTAYGHPSSECRSPMHIVMH